MRHSHAVKILLGSAVLVLGMSAGARAGDWCLWRRPLGTSGTETAARPVVCRHGPASPSADAGRGTQFGVQEFPWGYFGAVPCRAYAYHQTYYDEPIRGTTQRAD